MKPLIIYHDPCQDGFGAAFSAWKKFGDSAEYLGAGHGSYPQPDVDGREVYVLDFSFPRPQLEAMRQRAASLTILDHHKTAMEDLTGFPGAVFDMTRSGARLAWEHFHPGAEVPAMIQFIEDRDLWRWKLPGTQEYVAYLDNLPLEFSAWDELYQREVAGRLQDILSDGAAMHSKFEGLAREQINGIEPVTVLGVHGHKLNGGGMFTSRLGELMYQANGTFGMLWRIEKGQLRVSLRAREGTLDVGAMAKHFGGGGHRAAAAFRINLGTPEFENFFRTYILGSGA